ncbi:radical SAM superfamily enzyme [Lachnospiraceae bacterium JC7]|nr:radical SAM superfamily enzyme [Lachnospiraceae bacterium JC7]
MYKIKVNKHNLFNDNTTMECVYKHFAIRCGMMICKKSDGIYVITDEIVKKCLEDGVSSDKLAIEYADGNYPFVDEESVDEFVKKKCPVDTPVLDSGKNPIYIIKKGYIKTDSSRTEHYICKSITGLSDYNLSINADMTVSCQCVLRSEGELGSVKEATLKQVMSSKIACGMRNDLYDGFMPTYRCTNCPELVQVPKSVAQYFLKEYQVPKGLMLENTTICNLRCKGCYNAYLNKDTISEEDMIMISKELMNNGIQKLYLFKYGEVFADIAINRKIDIIREYNPQIYICISTNGMLLDIGNNMDAALKVDEMVFSLDGVDDDSVIPFQEGASFNRIYSNMKQLAKMRSTKSRPEIHWKYALFLHNDKDNNIKKAFNLAADAEIDYLDFCIGWNVEVRSSTLWRSEIFEKYMEIYDFKYDKANNMLLFDLKGNKGWGKTIEYDIY